MKFQGEADGPAAKGELSDYPHNLYLYLMYTVGAVGLLAVLGFLATLFARVFSASRFPIRDDAYVGLARLGVLVLGVVFVDQLKIEFLRFVAMDYWFYLFIVFGMLLGVSDLVRFRRADSGAGAHAASTAAAS
jgi:O-antigen ligase